MGSCSTPLFSKGEKSWYIQNQVCFRQLLYSQIANLAWNPLSSHKDGKTKNQVTVEGIFATANIAKNIFKQKNPVHSCLRSRKVTRQYKG